MIKKCKKTLAVAMTVALSFISIYAGAADVSAAVKPTLSKTQISLKVGKKSTLTLKNVKKDEVSNVKWTTSNKKVATVSPSKGASKAVIKGISAGKATIKAKLDSKTYSCKVSVKKVNKSVKLEKVTLPMYFHSVDNKESITVYFADKNHEIPYIDAATVSGFLNRIYHEMNRDNDFDVTYKVKGSKTVFTRENGQTMELDCENDTLYFKNYDAFFMPTYSPTAFEVLEHYGIINCLKRVEDRSYTVYGKAVSFNLGAYNIDLIEENGFSYIPLQTFGDICISLSCYTNFFYNGQGIYVNESYSNEYEKDMYNKYLADAERNPTRSREIIDFTYNEMCMTLDYLYGLKEQHGIQSFDDFITENGLKERLTSTDALEASRAVYDFTFFYLGDLHSSFRSRSWRIGGDAVVRTRWGSSVSEYFETMDEIEKERAKYFPNGVSGYQEIGDTAYITFDEFVAMPSKTDYYINPPTADTNDSVGICLYAFSQITRPGSPVKNVVLDMSLNGGGDATTVAFVASMFLGKADFCLEDTLTGTIVNNCYCCDANLDGMFDERDSLKGYRLFCLTSPCSFSCSNLVASVLKNSNRVHTIGMTSFGGTCVVLPLTLADGTGMNISSNRRVSYMENGAVYDIDRGVEPDYPITSFDRFYDRVALNKYINGLY